MAAAVVSCRRVADTGGVSSSASAPATVVRLDLAADTIASGGNARLASSDAFARWMQIVGDTTSSAEAFVSSHRIAAFLPDVTKAFPSVDSIASALGAVFDAAGGRRTVYTVVSPYLQSVVLVGDTAVYVSLNHYLGADHPAYSGFPDYQRRLKTPDRLPVDVAEAVFAASDSFDGSDSASLSTLIARMLHDGVLVECVMQALGMSEQQALGYTDDEMRWADGNESRVWDEMLRRRMIFSTDPMLSDRLLNPAPSTSVISASLPGRLGRFIGHRIVASWLRANPATDNPARLLQPSFYGSLSTLQQAAYKP